MHVFVKFLGCLFVHEHLEVVVIVEHGLPGISLPSDLAHLHPEVAHLLGFEPVLGGLVG